MTEPPSGLQVNWASVLLAQALGQVVISPFALVVSGQHLRRLVVTQVFLPCCPAILSQSHPKEPHEAVTTRCSNKLWISDRDARVPIATATEQVLWHRTSLSLR